MRLRRKFILGFLLTAGLILVVLGTVYAWVVLRPTGYEAFARQNAPTLLRVQAALTTTTLASLPPLASVPASTSTTSSGVTPPRAVAPINPHTTTPPGQVPPSDFRLALCEPDLIEKDLAAAQLTCPGAINVGIFLQHEREQPLELAFAHDAAGALKTAAALLPWIQNESKTAAAQAHRGLGAPWAKALGAPASPAGRKVAATLDQMETLLLSGRLRNCAFKDFPREFHAAAFKDLAVQAVLRRARQGDAALAERLLVATLETVRAIRIGTFPNQDPTQSPATNLEVVPLLLGLAELDAFPDEALARAARLLDQSMLNGPQAGDLLSAHIVRQRDAAREAITASRVETGYSVLKYFLGGLPDRIRYRILQPALLAEIDRLAVQWSKVNDQGQDKLRALREAFQTSLKVESIMNMMGIQRPAATALHAHTNAEFFNQNGAFALDDFLDTTSRSWLWVHLDPINQQVMFNKPVQLERLALALARYRRKHHQFPDRLAALTPEFLDSASVAELQKTWGLIPLAPDTKTGALAVALIACEPHHWPLEKWRTWIARWPVSPEARRYTDNLVKKGAAGIELVQPEIIRLAWPLGK